MSGGPVIERNVRVAVVLLLYAPSKRPVKCRCCCRVSPEMPASLNEAFVVSHASPAECLDDVDCI